MNNKKILLYFDILGFDDLAKEIAKIKKIDVRDVREKFLNIFDSKLREPEIISNILGVSPGRDDKVIVLEENSMITPLNSCIHLIGHILNHDTGYGSPYDQIPLEIGIGYGSFDKNSKFNGKGLIKEQSTIDFLKSKLIVYYHKKYQEQYGMKIKESFVILTEEAFLSLNPIDRLNCSEIVQFVNYTEIKYYLLDLDYLQSIYTLSEFLRKLGIYDDFIFNRMNQLYVPPLEYEEIEKTLNDKRIIFLTGTPEFGKTYTAIYLMFQYFKKGYITKWIHGEENLKRLVVRDALENISRVLRPHHIIYFEDPFGKIEYEKRESLEREINTIIDSVETSQDVYVIITSREEIFKKFKREAISIIYLENYEKRINILKPSYEFYQRKNMLLAWAKYNSCLWFDDGYLKNSILNQLEIDDKLLPTPLSIKDFSISSKKSINLSDLKDVMEKKSQETSKAFAKEIIVMSESKKLFLSILMITEPILITDINSYYNSLYKEIEITKNESFNDIFNWFNGDKITLKEEEEYPQIAFSHPSYLEALNHLINDDELFRNIFFKCLEFLTDNEESLDKISHSFNLNYIHFPDNLQQKLLVDLSENVECMVDCMNILKKVFNSTNTEIRNEVLRNILGFRDIVEFPDNDFFTLINDNYKKIPKDIIKEYNSAVEVNGKEF